MRISKDGNTLEDINIRLSSRLYKNTHKVATHDTHYGIMSLKNQQKDQVISKNILVKVDSN